VCVCRETIVEKFKDSSNEEVAEGSSSLYDWGFHPIKEVEDAVEKPKHHPNKHHGHRHKKHETCKDEEEDPKYCYDCDITTNKNINKYVLKSSIPPCPDMSEYAKKSQIPPNIDLKRYILKSQIPSCDCPNIKNYIKKSEVPSCPEVPLCPKCPICPVCPQIDGDYISINEVKRDYVKKSHLEKYCKKIAHKMISGSDGSSGSNGSSGSDDSPGIKRGCQNYNKYTVAKKAPKPFNPGILNRMY
tara:strand:- start:8155 stop:8886 length:732 start_codon:yes stop_codon:yes gene_type:complete